MSANMKVAFLTTTRSPPILRHCDLDLCHDLLSPGATKMQWSSSNLYGEGQLFVLTEGLESLCIPGETVTGVGGFVVEVVVCVGGVGVVVVDVGGVDCVVEFASVGVVAVQFPGKP